MRNAVGVKKRGATVAQLVSHEGALPGSEYDADQVELIQAMQRYMRAANVRFPSFVEVLEVAKSLGWRKVAPSEPAPESHHRKKAK